MLFHVSINELNDFAISFWQLVKEAKLMAFHGEMGAGKTTLITALCKNKSVQDVITSPTFSIINEYRFVENGIEKRIYHIDLYRLNNMAEIMQAGVEDCIYSGDICFIEWPEKIPELLKENTVHIFVKTMENSNREVKIETPAAS